MLKTPQSGKQNRRPADNSQGAHIPDIWRKLRDRVEGIIFGGPTENRTRVQGFAVLCVTTPPSGLTVAVEARSSGLPDGWQLQSGLLWPAIHKSQKKLPFATEKQAFV